MLKLKEHYKIEGVTGWKPWYELALAIACEFDLGLKIIDYAPPKGKTAPKWRGAHGKQLFMEVETARLDGQKGKLEAALQQVYNERRQRGERVSIAQFRKNYFDAKRHIDKQRARYEAKPQKART